MSSDNAAFVINAPEAFYILGGYTKDCWEFPLSNYEWHKLPQLNFVRKNGFGAVLGRNLYLMGGYKVAGRTEHISKNIEKLNLDSKKNWEEITQTIPEFWNQCLTVPLSKKYLLIFGGFNGQNKNSNFWIWNIETGQYQQRGSKDVDPAWQYIKQGDKIYTMDQQAVNIYDIQNGQWSTVRNFIPIEKKGCCLVY